MNPFYDISASETELEHPLQLKNLGEEQVRMSYGVTVRDAWGMKSYNDNKRYATPTTANDYDRQFLSKFRSIEPIYDAPKLLDYHLAHYIQNSNGDKNTFIRHIKYTILPMLGKNKQNILCYQLINEWIEGQTKPNSTAIQPVQNFITNNIQENSGSLNIATGVNVTQNVSVAYLTNEDNERLKSFGLLQEEIDELKNILAAGTSNKSSAKDKALKWLGSVSASVAARGLYENIPAISEYVSKFIS